MSILKKIFLKLFSTSAAGLYMILFAIAIGVATFVENDFGTSAAQKIIFKARWFELLLLLFGISIVVNIFRYRLIQQKKWGTFAFHASMIVILFGAAITRYASYEGMMHIRQGESSNYFLSSDEYLSFQARMSTGASFDFSEPVLFASLGNNSFKEKYLLGNKEVEVEVLEFIPNPKERIESDEEGKPLINIVMGGANGREEYFLELGQQSRIKGTLFNFSNTELPEAFNIKYENEQLFFKADRTYSQMVMATQELDTLESGAYYPLALRSLYSDVNRSFVFANFHLKGKRTIYSSDIKMASNSRAALKVKVSHEGQSVERYLFGMKGAKGRAKIFPFGEVSIAISYGAKPIYLPFSLKLRNFILEKYPGTDNASSYESEVTLLDDRYNINRNERIYMNNILNYGGYRFFQSSFDQDEQGTYLSVNHDFWGTLFSYIGYGILTLGMIFTFMSKNSRFHQLSDKLAASRKATAIGGIILFLIIPNWAEAKTPRANNTVSIEHAEKFGQTIMQDHKGRMKPMNTYCSEILRKLSRKTNINGLSPEQVILGMTVNPKDWYSVPMIKIGKHKHTRELIPIEGDLASYKDFFNLEGKYILQEYIRDAYNTPKKDRGVFEKDMLKLDEKINICGMVFNGSFLRSFPVPNDENNLWTSPAKPMPRDGETYAWNFYSTYVPAIEKAYIDGNWSIPDRLLVELGNYQAKYGAEVIPSNTKINAELILNNMKVFGRLGMVYGILSVVFLSLLFLTVFKPNINLKWAKRIALSVFLLAVFMHLFGLGLRWYVSGRAPWSNGYESMIYIGFTTVLAGAIFARKSLGGLTATCTLAATIMMVAGLSWLDPEITPLVPVLKSYWLTIHVSLEAGSYGFLMLGAIIGVLNLIFIILRNQKNQHNVNRIIKELGYISEMTLMVGLFMISVGTYLGGVWANESWGRYWGWDAKETWALVTILIYAFILHMRFIPGLRGPLAYNIATLFGWSSVIMTYFGVNYYLSGLHSYAAGDPVPIPSFVYYAVAILTIISLVAFWRNRKYLKAKKV